MNFDARSKEDIAYYLKSIANINGLSFDSIDTRFGITVIRCSKKAMTEEHMNAFIKKITDEKTTCKIDYYDDPVGGLRISIK